MKTRSIAVAVSVICAACAFGAGPAAAETPHAGHTLFSGAMTMSPAIPPMPIFGGSGSFSFSGSCSSASAWVSGGDDLSDRDVAETGTCYGISFSGYYDFNWCGTGTVTGTATIDNVLLATSGQHDPGGEVEGPLTANIDISFVNGVGTLTITGGNWDGDPTVTGAGTMYLSNMPGESCLGPNSTTGFYISGDMTFASAAGT